MINKRLYSNNAKTTLATMVAPADTYISCVDASKFPTLTAGTYFLATLDNGSGSVEVIKVTGVVGNNLTPVVRAQEGTVASSFPVGARIENRVTRDTLGSFMTTDNVFVELSSLDLLVSPANSMSTSYICHTNDDGGNPIIAMKNTTNSWRFNSHPSVAYSGAVGSATTTSITSTTSATTLAAVAAGKYIIQFTTGVNAGNARIITSVSGSVINWATAFTTAPSAGDQFEVYKSTTSTISDLQTQSSNGIIYSILLSTNN